MIARRLLQSMLNVVAPSRPSSSAPSFTISNVHISLSQMVGAQLSPKSKFDPRLDTSHDELHCSLPLESRICRSTVVTASGRSKRARIYSRLIWWIYRRLIWWINRRLIWWINRRRLFLLRTTATASYTWRFRGMDLDGCIATCQQGQDASTDYLWRHSWYSVAKSLKEMVLTPKARYRV
jgi:hypothetical protein